MSTSTSSPASSSPCSDRRARASRRCCALIAGFVQHQQGELLIDGVDISPLAPWERNIGMVFQSYALWPHLSVWDNVAFGLVERKVDKASLRKRVGDALELVGLASYA